MFKLYEIKSYSEAMELLQFIEMKLEQIVKLDELHTLCWEDDRVHLHGYTKYNRKSVRVTVENEGGIYCRVEGNDVEFKIGNLFT